MNHSSSAVKTLSKSLPLLRSYFDDKNVYCITNGKEHDLFGSLSDGKVGPLVSVFNYVVDHMVASKGNNVNNKQAEIAHESWFPATASTREPYHFAQIMNSGRF